MTFQQPDPIKQRPYYDDFNEEKQFLQVLFKPGYAVQARELTQLQTILQNQISKVSDHLFTDGTRIFGGEASVGTYFFARVMDDSLKTSTNQIIYYNPETIKQYFYNTFTKNWKSFVPIRVRLNETTYGPQSPDINLDSQYRQEIFDLEEDFQIQLIDLIPSTPSDQNIIIFKFLKGSLEKLNKFVISNNDKLILREVTSYKNETTGEYEGNYNLLKAIRPQDNPNPNPISFEFIPKVIRVHGSPTRQTIYLENFNTCQVAFIEEGLYYKDGRFIRNPKTQIPIYTLGKALGNNRVEIEETQKTGLSYSNISTIDVVDRKLFSYPSKKIGYDIVVDTVNFVEDTSLLDNASGFSNERAPGADRLTYNLVPSQKPFDDTQVSSYDGTNFIEVARLKKGALLFAKRNTEYSEILKLFARRTYDESGSYTVKPFPIEFKEHLRQDEYTLNFAQQIPTTVEVGDLLFGTGDINPEIRMAKLVKPGTDRRLNPSLIYPIEITNEPIGVIKGVETNKLIVTLLNRVSFNSLDFGASITIKKSDNDEIITIGNLTGSNNQIEYFYDEKGIYLLSSPEAGDDSKFVAKMGLGKGYIEGFEVETLTPENVTIDKARETLRTYSDINVLLENQIIMSANSDTLFPTTTINDNLMEEQLTIRANSLLVQIDFTGMPVDGVASTNLIELSPFTITNLLRPSLPNISVRNRQTVLFCEITSSTPT